MKGRWIVGSIALVMLGYALAVAADTTRGPSKIAFVSVKRLIAEAPDVQSALGKLRVAQQEALVGIRAKQQALEETRRKIAVASNADRAKLQQQERDQAAELQQATAQAQAELQTSQRETVEVLQTHLRPVLQNLARSENLDAILNADMALLWGSTQLDITSTVIQRLNADSAGKTAKP
jgi:Skp family chaperone for outer membrane proteins